MFRGQSTPAQFFDEQLVRLIEGGAAQPKRKADVIFEVIGPSGGRWRLHLDKRSTVERVDNYAQGQLLIRMDEALFPGFLDGTLELQPAVEEGHLALAGDLGLLDELAEMWSAPMSMVALRANKKKDHR
ncbi:MAG: hypothetical protein U1E65_18015 [Myxococcota bacterium]